MNATYLKYVIVFALLNIILINSALADPPFLSDSPIPTSYRNVDFYLFSNFISEHNSVALAAPAFEIDYGILPNAQIQLVVPYATNFSENTRQTAGIGDIQLGGLYRFIEESNNFPQLALQPIFQLPTGNMDRNLGNGRLSIRLPLLLQKTWSDWRIYGGPGYFYNPAPDKFNYVFGSMVVEHQLNDAIMLGVEIYSQGRDEIEDSAITLLNLGGSYNVTKTFSILGSIGHTFIGKPQTIGYLGAHWTF